MEREQTEVYCGNGRGKTTLAMGQSLRASAQGKSVIIIQFLKGNERRDLDFLEELNQMDIKIFRFERMEACYNDLSPKEQDEEKRNILNGLNFARKVVATQECDFLVLDEILGLLDKGIATPEMIGEILKQKDESMHIVLTGRQMSEGLLGYVDSVTTLNTTEY
ncbi:MAG: cob(I)yrinic acid a,c-diamide adenosyltransferase [Eubacteriales bacterium]|nr:cob(I)yrinic acid a,c-diamide adenosyltransferase [Eubacteriales bacterium]